MHLIYFVHLLSSSPYLSSLLCRLLIDIKKYLFYNKGGSSNLQNLYLIYIAVFSLCISLPIYLALFDILKKSGDLQGTLYNHFRPLKNFSGLYGPFEEGSRPTHIYIFRPPSCLAADLGP